jgi:hypothetical protein
MKFRNIVLLVVSFSAQLILSAHASERKELEIYRCEFACPYEAGATCYNYIFRNEEGKFEDEHIIYDVLENDWDLLLTHIIWPYTEWDLPEAIGGIFIHIQKPQMANGNRYIYRRYCAGEFCDPDLAGKCEFGQPD